MKKMKKHFASSATGAKTGWQTQNENIQQTLCRVEMVKEHPGVQQSHTRFLFIDGKNWASLVLPFLLKNCIKMTLSIFSRSYIKTQKRQTPSIHLKSSILLKLVLCHTFKHGHSLAWHHKGLFSPLNNTFFSGQLLCKMKKANAVKRMDFSHPVHWLKSCSW